MFILSYIEERPFTRSPKSIHIAHWFHIILQSFNLLEKRHLMPTEARLPQLLATLRRVQRLPVSAVLPTMAPDYHPGLVTPGAWVVSKSDSGGQYG